jgi:hypothetical protein
MEKKTYDKRTVFDVLTCVCTPKKNYNCHIRKMGRKSIWIWVVRCSLATICNHMNIYKFYVAQ